MELKQKGAKADIGAFNQIKVSLIWTAAVDLDLMAFYKTKDGQVGGIWSENYASGDLGNLDRFPFVRLSGDAGVGGTGGDNREEMQIARLDDFEDLYICALNFTDASASQNTVFANYDARVQVATDRGEVHTVPLDSTRPGPVAVICKFASGFIASELVNDSEVMDLETFQAKIPGAGQLKLASKVTLQAKGDSFLIKPKAAAGEILINLNWNAHPEGRKEGGFFSKLMGGAKNGGAIDLDLGCLFEMQNGSKGAIQPLGNSFGAFDMQPYVFHLGDDRTGAQAAGENMKINLAQISALKRVLIYTYIYEGVPNWTSTDGVVTVRVPGQPVLEVPMGSQMDARPFCAIAMLDFSGGNINVTKLVSFHQGHPDCDKTYQWGLRWVEGSKD
ncbi:stress response protein [Desulfonema ishimotonii]|uniref:Stress response protein n=1 Tax=Desulfonema ishimotonii TaxID=45657 RepID=A0A401FSC5_9BACT|nr:stress response protein [Desulfonema ishimotonii]GBC59867.1 stress response protein [Desulfonema ishimotonii]